MSSLLELDLSLVQSNSGESTITTQSCSKKWRSPVWVYYRRPTENENQDFLYCSCCPPDSILLPYGTDISENMKKYLRRHGITIEKALSKNQVAMN